VALLVERVGFGTDGLNVRLGLVREMNTGEIGARGLDDWGPDRLTAPQRRDLMEIVEDRYGNGSILITSQLPVDAWHEVIAERRAGRGGS
jgi:hypothetical protein